MRIGVVTFPGSLDDRSALRAIELGGGTPVPLFHGSNDLKEVQAVILPGGFSYGDYLRCGAISRFSPIMESIILAAEHGFPVLGICNGFQILCESHLLPGALTRNADLHFICADQKVSVENTNTPWTNNYKKGQEIETVIISVDVEKERIALGIKQLDTDPYSLFITTHDKGSLVEGTVKSVTSTEAVIELADGIDAVLPVREASNDKIDDLTSILKDGDKIEVLITNIDKKYRTINVSIKAKDAQEEAATIKKIKSTEKSSGTTNLGALLQDKFKEE